MNFIDAFGKERISYRNSLSLKKIFEANSDKLFKNHEYVVVWYKKISNKSNDGKKQVEILFVNISTKKPSNFQISINISINYLHKIKIGSIWINGSSKEIFKNDVFNISMTEDNYSITSFYGIRNSSLVHPFPESAYPINDLLNDKNKLILIDWKNKIYILHPLTFFIVHYGYSMEIKRVLLSYLWQSLDKNHDSVLNLFNISDPNSSTSDNVVVLPKKLTIRDAIFLYHLKNDLYTQNRVKHVTNSARHALVNTNPPYDFYPVIRPWHDQQIDLEITGIKLNESTIFCTGISGISEPIGPDITLIMPPVYKKNIQEIEITTKDAEEIAIKLRRKKELEKVLIDDSKKVNNLHVATIKEKLGILGNSRTIHKNYEIIENGVVKKYKLIESDEPKEFSVGAGEGGNGKTGLADCFYDTRNAIGDTYSNDERLQKLWDHAQNLKADENAKVHWFTFTNGFNDSLKFKTMSMSSCHLNDTTSYPNEVLIIRVIMNEYVYIVIDFAPEKNISTDKEMSKQGVVIKLQESIESFLNVHNDTGLSSILIHIATMNGNISFDYIDSFKGKMVGFRHRDGKNNNWILNSIGRIS
ncbi:hypothetical protein A7P54_15560 [Acinetobacter sp. Ac_3412]|uniref:hypothetical protein n=1 Tax=Acinetobacter sp. Ac_3412 TaxID=1848935 RepID=UPI00148F46D0|nr:hypothetical protein [Acinetobacter sp. Ac_3412]NNP77822.1 hypothetical protein [Acinetobacter sp. Ac_3412]